MGQEPDQTRSPAASYVEVVMNNLRAEVEPCQGITSDPSGRCVDCGEDLDHTHGKEPRCLVEIFGETVLEVVRLQKPHLFFYDNDDEETAHESDDFAEVLGFAFVVSTGGPHLQFETTDQGRTWTGHYWDWFMSDQERVTLDGQDCAILHDVLGHWFDAYGPTHGNAQPYEMRTGHTADLTAEDAAQRLSETAPRWHHAPRRPFGTQKVSQ
jgi:hypothetical protein